MANSPEFTFSPVLGMLSVGPEETNNEPTLDSRSSGSNIVSGSVKGTKITSARVTVANLPLNTSNPINATLLTMFVDFKVGPKFVGGNNKYYRVGHVEIPQDSPYGFQRILTFSDLVLPENIEFNAVFSVFGGGGSAQLRGDNAKVRLDIVVCGGNF